MAKGESRSEYRVKRYGSDGWKVAAVVLALVSLTVGGYCSVMIVDQRSTIAMLQEGYASIERDLQFMEKVTPAISAELTKEDFLARLNKLSPTERFMVDSDSVRVGDMQFVFGEKALKEIRR